MPLADSFGLYISIAVFYQIFLLMNKGQFTWHNSTTQMGVFKSKISTQGNNLQAFRQTLKSLVITATQLAVSSAFIHK